MKSNHRCKGEEVVSPVLEPTVGAVDTTEPRVILYMSVVLPALSRLRVHQAKSVSIAGEKGPSGRRTYPRMQILSSLEPKSDDQSELKATPMAECVERESVAPARVWMRIEPIAARRWCRRARVVREARLHSRLLRAHGQQSAAECNQSLRRVEAVGAGLFLGSLAGTAAR